MLLRMMGRQNILNICRLELHVLPGFTRDLPNICHQLNPKPLNPKPLMPTPYTNKVKLWLEKGSGWARRF